MTRKTTRGRYAKRTLPIRCQRCQAVIAYDDADVDGFPEPHHWADVQFFEVGAEDDSASMTMMVITCRKCGTENTTEGRGGPFFAQNTKHGFYLGRGRWLKLPD